MKRIIVIGGGAAGMMAAVTAAEMGANTILFDKNEKTGKKIYITGKGRCNLTNNCDVESLLQAVCTNRKFLYSAFYRFTSQDTIQFFEESGMPCKTEHGNRVFPVSDHSSDVISALNRRMRKSGVEVHLNTKVSEIALERVVEGNSEQTRVIGVILEDGSRVLGDAVIIATGGLSYRSTGSTGDGYSFARKLGHKIVDTSPSLVPLETEGDIAQRMQGLSLRNVEVTIKDGKKKLYQGFGEMMFTHFGVTGPLILTASTVIQKKLKDHPLSMQIDLKPALTDEQLDARILREFESGLNKQFKNILGSLFPAKMIPLIIDVSGISGEKPVNEITKEERRRLIDTTRHFPLTVTGTRDYNEAIVTRGGVSVKEINPGTMESKLINGLYFAGEVMDLDAVTGGYNLQIAWATGRLAGLSAAEDNR